MKYAYFSNDSIHAFNENLPGTSFLIGDWIGERSIRHGNLHYFKAGLG